MKSSMETSTQLTNDLQDLNQEIRQRLSSMRYSTEPEMQSLGQWLKETETEAKSLENLFFDNLPSFKNLVQRVQRESKAGFVKGLDGRKLLVTF